MRLRYAALPVLIGFFAAAAPAFANSVAVTSGPNGTTIVNGKPCRVVTRHGDDGSAANSTSITTGPNGTLSGSTSVSPGGSGTSMTVGSGSSSGGSGSSAAAGSDCVIYRNER